MKTRLDQRLLATAVMAMGLLPSSVRAEPVGETIDFNRDIRPILSENCFHCHGPDARARQADLRLDTYEGATADLGGYEAVVPGDAEQSEVFRRVMSDDEFEQMPPPESKRTLLPRQKELIGKWIAGGAEYQRHWAFVKPTRPAVPDVAVDGQAVGHAIDAFVLRRLQQEGLVFSPPADARTLIRRVSLDLIGLPPSPAEVAEFADACQRDADGAYEALVDRLLASPRFGERWARPWLDLARYADSNGFQADQLRDSWAYRDWVIDALNDNLPFDRFTIEQLAGDLLPDATLGQQIATGFHRTVTCNVEAGVHPEENRTNQVIDRVNTTGTVWLGVTMECAQCHDHKYDPFTMEDYYSLFAYFNNTPLEVELPSGKGDVSHDFIGPFLDLPLSPEQAGQRKQIEGQLAALEAKRREILNRAESEWLATREPSAGAEDPAPRWHVLEIDRFQSSGDEDHQILEDQSVLITGRVPNTTVYEATAETNLANITAFKIEVLTHDEIPGGGPGRGDAERANFILSELDITVLPAGVEEPQPIELYAAEADFSQAKWDVARAIDGDRQTGWAIGPEFHKPHWAVFRASRPVDADDGATLHFTLDQNFGRGRTIGRFRISAHVGELAAQQAAPDIARILSKPATKRTPADREKLAAFWSKSHPQLDQLALQKSRLQKQLDGLKPSKTLVMVERDQPRTTHVLARGNYLDPQQQVAPRTPQALDPLDPDLPANRLGLARWLVAPDNPLTARVTVNRWWAELFGQGIVATLEDFGTQSDPPTHPELLDWLAVEFIQSGWDRKHILKQMVMSATYRQDARVTDGLLARDPANRLYGRAPRLRLDAERIRDNGLAVSGLLSTQMHGRPVMPYQPLGIWRQVGRNEPRWQEAKDANRWRRGIYIVYRRAAPYPSMVNFDAPDRGACTVRRGRTNTPLQALTLLNDPAYVEMALALADRVLAESPQADSAARLERAYQIVLARSIRDAEREHLAGVLEKRLTQFEADPAAAAALIAGASTVYAPRHRNRVELAAWLFVANILLNLDETITRS